MLGENWPLRGSIRIQEVTFSPGEWAGKMFYKADCWSEAGQASWSLNINLTIAVDGLGWKEWQAACQVGKEDIVDPGLQKGYIIPWKVTQPWVLDHHIQGRGQSPLPFFEQVICIYKLHFSHLYNEASDSICAYVFGGGLNEMLCCTVFILSMTPDT